MPKHISRLILLLVGFLAFALLVKEFLTDDSFYRFGHYCADSVVEIAAKDPVHRTPKYCRDCHVERVAQWSASNHKSVSCEVCHGAAQDHPAKGKLPIPADARKLCTLCHEAMPARPQAHPQVNLAQHSFGQQCIACHNPHAPKIVSAAAKVTGDAAAGAKGAASCAACHGEKGISPNDTWPSLAGQPAAYLARILGAYKSGDQQDVVMTPIAQALSDADVQNLAAFYSRLSCKGPAGKPPGDVAAGKVLAKNCASCHGETGIATNAAWPTLAGQKPGYLVNVMKAFRAGLRKDPMMAGVTRGLSDADIVNLAAYYALQDCEATPEGRSKR